MLSVNSLGDNEEPYPSLSDYHDYEPNLEFDDSELHQTPDAVVNTGNKISVLSEVLMIKGIHLFLVILFALLLNTKSI